jgi:hypothetical protein
VRSDLNIVGELDFAFENCGGVNLWHAPIVRKPPAPVRSSPRCSNCWRGLTEEFDGEACG